MKFKLMFLTLGLMALSHALQAQFNTFGATRLFTTDSVGLGVVPGHLFHVLGNIATNGSLAYIRAANSANGGSALTLEMPQPLPGQLLGSYNLLRGVVNNQNVFSINRQGSADFNGSLSVGGRSALGGNTTVTGSSNDGQTAALEVRSGTQRMLLDGNEIDGVTDGLYLNNNTNQNVFINRGGGRTLFGTGSAPTAKVEIRHNSTYDNPALEITEESTDYARIYFRNVTNNARRFSIGGNPGAENPRFNLSFNEGGGTYNILVVDGEHHSVGIGTANPESRLQVAGRITTDELLIKGGSDLSENFDVATSVESKDLLPGMLVSINPHTPGALQVTNCAYDHKVAGIISGANGVNTGLRMGQKGSEADGKYPVALAGRVYVLADASEGSIHPGDLLTSSVVPGHVMKVKKHSKAQGAIVGKAMTPLAEGRGYVLVLVNLQ